jgi:hypothetical protein
VAIARSRAAGTSRRSKSTLVPHAVAASNEGSLIHRHTGNLEAVQLLLGHTKIESTVRHIRIEVDDALAIAEEVDS